MNTIDAVKKNSSEDLSSAGDYVFIKKREARTITITKKIVKPKGFLKIINWLFSKKEITNEIRQEALWPTCDTVIMICPICQQPVAFGEKHNLSNVETSLTVDLEISCPYVIGAHKFSISSGKINFK